jgi:hypothetical protein
MPIDNVQKFERLCDDANYIQLLADKGAEMDEVNGLTEALRSDIEYGIPVSITGGLIEVSSFNEELEATTAFIPLEGEVSGKYIGLSWRNEEIEFPDGSKESTWRLCHDVGGEESIYIDQHGDRISRTPVTYITVEGSRIELMSAIKCHDYRELALDGVCLLIDQLAFDLDRDLNSKAEEIAKFFRISNAHEISPDNARKVRQRISYLNELGMFTTALVATPLAIRRTDKGVEILKTVDNNLIASVQHVATDQAITAEGEWVENTSAISYEVIADGLGHLSIPHIPGVTRLYNRA